jgi:hypothetical protein
MALFDDVLKIGNLVTGLAILPGNLLCAKIRAG